MISLMMMMMIMIMIEPSPQLLTTAFRDAKYIFPVLRDRRLYCKMHMKSNR